MTGLTDDQTASPFFLADLVDRFDRLNAAEVLAEVVRRAPGEVVFSTSFGFEDQLITHLIAAEKLPIRLFTLDTGRLFPETYSTWRSTLDRYKLSIETYYPDAASLGTWVTQHGPDAFYESVELRMSCCNIRKVEPLKRALAGVSVWITGLRAEQSPNRSNMQPVEWDAGHRVWKVHPLLHWTQEHVWEQIRLHVIPYNPLHDRGMVSIGCAPCTRAIRPGEDFRAGRWWWEDQSKKECGLHESKGSGNVGM